MKKDALIQITECAEPAERAGKKNDSRDITEQQIPEPAAATGVTRKPDRDDEWGERNPTKPSLVEWWETKNAEQSTAGSGQPRPHSFQGLDHEFDTTGTKS